MKYSYDSYKSLIVVNRNISKDYFLSRAGALHGYAKDMFSRIYDSIFSEAECVDDILNKYYYEEYEKWKTFYIPNIASIEKMSIKSCNLLIQMKTIYCMILKN